jgi:hypothetical protein
VNDGDSSAEVQQEKHIFLNDFEAVDSGTNEEVETNSSSTNREEKPAVISHRNSVPACDFDDNDYSLTCAFPYIFPLGQAYGRSTGTLNREQLNHLFTQFHQAPARDRKLLAYVFDNKRRTQTMLGVKVLSKGNSKAYRKMDEVVNATGFQDRLEAAVNDPESKDARELLKTLHNCLTIAGRNQSYGSHELRNVVPTIKEISKSLGPPSAFVTCSLDSKGNPRAFRLSKAVVTNRDMPAHLPTDKLHEFIQKMVGDGNAEQENNYFPFPMDEGARAKEGIDNPIAYVQEFMAVVHSLLSVVIGIVPENFFSQMSGRTTRKTVHLNKKGALGHVLSYYGVIEANNRGDLHFHLICFGSLPPHVLTNFATCPDMRKKISDVFKSYYTTQLDREFIIYKAIQNVLSERRSRRLPVFALDKQNTANLLKAERVTPVDGLMDHNSKENIRERTRMQASQQQVHDHIRFTCSKGIMGNTGCRYNRPYACNEEINVVRLSARQKIPGTEQYNSDDGGKDDKQWIATNVEDCSVWESKSPIDSLDRTVFYWDLARPHTVPMAEPFQQCAEYMEGSISFLEHEKKEKARLVAEQLCDSGPSFLRSNLDEMTRLHLDDLLNIFCAVNRKIFDMNGKVVEHSSLISDVTGSHNNVAILGSSEQGKAAAFYLGPYFSKEKFGFEESLLIMALANKHIHTFPSTAEDTGTDSRNTKFFIQRCLNQHCLKMEVSDYQMAAAVLSMPVIIRSNNVSFVDPHSAIAYMEDKIHPVLNDTSSIPSNAICCDKENLIEKSIESKRCNKPGKVASVKPRSALTKSKKVKMSYNNVGVLESFGSIVDVPGDGSCGYHAVQIGLEELGKVTKCSVTDLRKKLHTHASEHREALYRSTSSNENSFDEIVLAPIFMEGISFDGHVSGEYWMDASTVGPVIAHLFGVSLVVFWPEETGNKANHTMTYRTSENGNVEVFQVDETFVKPNNMSSTVCIVLGGRHYRYLRLFLSG